MCFSPERIEVIWKVSKLQALMKTRRRWRVVCQRKQTSLGRMRSCDLAVFKWDLAVPWDVGDRVVFGGRGAGFGAKLNRFWARRALQLKFNETVHTMKHECMHIVHVVSSHPLNKTEMLCQNKWSFISTDVSPDQTALFEIWI